MRITHFFSADAYTVTELINFSLCRRCLVIIRGVCEISDGTVRYYH